MTDTVIADAAAAVDLADLDLFERGEAWSRFDTLRRVAPVHWNPEPAPNSGFWSVTRHERSTTS
jgi:hypothetical protein